MADMVNEAVEAGVICGPARKAQKRLDIKRFLKHIRDHGPDEGMVHERFTEFVSITDSADIDWTDAARALFNHLISRLEALTND